MYPYEPPWLKPIKLSRIQFRLAVELAAQEAGKAEISRQISAQLSTEGFPVNVTISGADADIQFTEYPQFDVNGMPVEWID